MKTIKVTAKSNKISLENAWSLITEIEKYPSRVKFVKKVKVYGRGEGSRWDDVTTILWVPLTMHHTVTSYKKNKEYSFKIPLGLGGKMRQKYILIKETPNTIKVDGSITYDLGSKLLNKTIGIILQRRLKKMLVSSIQNIGGEVD